MNFKSNPSLRIMSEVPTNLMQSIFVDVTGESFWAMPLRYRGFGVFASMSGGIWSLNLSTHKLAKVTDLGNTIYCSPIVVGDYSIWGTDGGSLVKLAFAETDGMIEAKIVWKTELEHPIHGNFNLSFDKKSIILPVYDRGVAIVDFETGALRAVVPCLSGVDEDPYAAPMPLNNEQFAIGTQNSELVFTNAGKLLAEFKTEKLVDSTPAFHQELNLLIFCSEDGSVRIVDTKTLELLKVFQTGSAIYASPAVWKHYCAIGNQSDNLFILNLLDFSFKSFQLGTMEPALYAKEKKNRLHYTGISTYRGGFCFVDGIGRINFFSPENWEHKFITPEKGAHTSPLVCGDGVILAGSHFGQLLAIPAGYLQ